MKRPSGRPHAVTSSRVAHIAAMVLGDGRYSVSDVRALAASALAQAPDHVAAAAMRAAAKKIHDTAPLEHDALDRGINLR